mmetsp:Transcript_14371/g.16062  ORF Transcript_14371/g.16062 Transcript_14371/m.16062 type:complete len:103 (+) Transcript_14371:292-600(+)
MFILNTRDRTYGDPEDSPCCCMIGTVPLPLVFILLLTPIIDGEMDVYFWTTYALFVMLYAYCTYAVMERLMDKFKCKGFPYSNPITWVAIPIIFLVFVAYFC